MGKRIAAMAILLSLAIGSPPAFAQPTAQPTPEDIAAADRLFQEGKKLHDAKNYAEAIPKFEAVLKVVNKVNTELRLADCYERTGRIASAYGLFKDAVSKLRAPEDEQRRNEASARAQALEPRLPYATLQVPKEMADVSSFSVIDGDRQINRALWGNPFPIDPGKHVFKATAEGYEQATVEQEIAVSEKITIKIPTLVQKPGTIDTPVGPGGVGPVSDSGSSLKTGAYVAAAVGAVGLGVGAVFGGLTFSKWNEKDWAALCKVKTDACPPESVEASKTAYTFATASNVGFGVAIAGAIAFTVLYIKAPKKNPTTSGQTMQFTPIIDRSRLGGNVLLRF